MFQTAITTKLDKKELHSFLSLLIHTASVYRFWFKGGVWALPPARGSTPAPRLKIKIYALAKYR
jgi:hypothetical protein